MTKTLVRFTEPFGSSLDLAPIIEVVVPFLAVLGAKPTLCATRTLLSVERGEFASRTLELEIEVESDIEFVPDHLEDLLKVLKNMIRRIKRTDLVPTALVVSEPSA